MSDEKTSPDVAERDILAELARRAGVAGKLDGGIPGRAVSHGHVPCGNRIVSEGMRRAREGDGPAARDWTVALSDAFRVLLARVKR